MTIKKDFLGVNASRIDRIKQKTGAYVYINGEASDLKRTVIIYYINPINLIKFI